MWLHYCIFGVLILLSLLYNPNNKISKKFYIAFVFIIFFILATFRAIDIGNDTQEYYRVFELIRLKSSLTQAINFTRYEIGYVVLNYLVGKVTSNFSVVLAIVASFYLISVLRFIRKYAVSVSNVIILSFTFSMFYDVMNITRQCISVAIFLFAVDYLIERKAIKYFSLVVVASLFQTMSIVLLLLYFSPKTDFQKASDVVKWIGIIGIALIALGYITQIVQYLFPYYAHYFNTSYAEGGARSASFLFFIIRIGIVVFIWLLDGFKDFKNFNNEKNVFFQLMLLDCIVAAMSISFNMLDRFENFFCLGFIITISNTIGSFKKNKRIFANFMVIFLSFIYITIFLIFRSNWYGLFPYHFR
ncbi:EpsG family protein [Eubacterium sp. AM05-23]|uniref:EpsG family protein n=1 Tax=Eubacterium maltosivorans TaxID=2041044 RepID=A0A4P9C6Z7_EUBML|nr:MULTISPECIES: EpsG family protein [Eubacterium]QCT71200.1 EpsG family protein [Eubacterium maltosivorans]RHO59896.1 EpsG family protein [Eubacterium sp. AM05-23]